MHSALSAETSIRLVTLVGVELLPPPILEPWDFLVKYFQVDFRISIMADNGSEIIENIEIIAM